MTRGFTLVELLVVILVVALLAGLAIGVGFFTVEKTREMTTETRVHTLGCRAQELVSTRGFAPASLEDIAGTIEEPTWRAGGKFVDAWERPLEYAPSGKRFRLWSCGRDGVSGSADDLEYKNR